MSGLLVFIVGVGLLFGTNKIREGFYVNTSAKNAYTNVALSWLTCYDMRQIPGYATIASNWGLTNFQPPFKRTMAQQQLATVLVNQLSKGQNLGGHLFIGMRNVTPDQEAELYKSEMDTMKADIESWGVLNKYVAFTLDDVKNLWAILAVIWTNMSAGETLTNNQTSFRTILTSVNPMKHITDIAAKQGLAGDAVKPLYNAEIAQMRSDINSWGSLYSSRSQKSQDPLYQMLVDQARSQARPQVQPMAPQVQPLAQSQARPQVQPLAQPLAQPQVQPQVPQVQPMPPRVQPQAPQVQPMAPRAAAPIQIPVQLVTTDQAWRGPEPNRNPEDLKWKSQHKSWKPPCEDSEMNPYSHCPDMSDYIKKDEIPCWNCSL